MQLFLFGAGYSAQSVASRHQDSFPSIWGTTRKEENFAKLKNQGISSIVFDADSGTVSPELIEKLRQSTHLLISVAPGIAHDKIVEILSENILPSQNNLQWIGYLSTTGVYGDQQGEWVTEETPAAPLSVHSINRLAAEQSLQLLSDRYHIPLSILRLAGIYGPGRNTFVSLNNGSARRILKPDHVFNRIHVFDIADTILHLAKSHISGIYNLADSFPASNFDVITYAADLMGIEPPPAIHFDDANLSPMALAFYSESKRISNKKLLNSGYKLIHPDYKSGLNAMWNKNNWQ